MRSDEKGKGWLFILAGIIGGIIALSASEFIRREQSTSPSGITRVETINQPVSLQERKMDADSGEGLLPISFRKAAERSLQEVVHIRARAKVSRHPQASDLSDFLVMETLSGMIPVRIDCAGKAPVRE